MAERCPHFEHAFDYCPVVVELPIPELVENRCRSAAMLPVGAPAQTAMKRSSSWANSPMSSASCGT